MKMLLLTYFFIEVIVTITLGGSIGGLNTFFEIVMYAVIGTMIIMNFRKVLMHSLAAVMSGKMSSQELVQGNILTLVGAVLLILPGFVSDLIGLFLQFSFIKSLLRKQVKQPYSQTNQSYSKKGDDDVIDVEIIEHTTSIK